MAVRSARNDLAWTRFAFSVSKRVGNAVKRNRVRRRLREILRVQPLLEGFDIVVVARPQAAEADFQSLKAEMLMLLKRARLLGDQA
jgi:ribonuclease P protein component